MEHVTCSHGDTFVITIEIDVYDVKRAPIDSCGSIDVHFLDTLMKMGKNEKDQKKVNFHLMGLISTTTYPVRASPYRYTWARDERRLLSMSPSSWPTPSPPTMSSCGVLL